MSKPLNILIVEDTETDAFLVQRILQKGGYEVSSEVVCTSEAMRSALESKTNWDVITSDHSMPQFSAPEALALAKELCPDVPFIIVSGEIDLNLAVSLMKDGAQDYIQKKELERLIPAIGRELSDVELRHDRNRVNNALAASEEALQNSENLFKSVFENSVIGQSLTSVSGEININNTFCEMIGYSKNELEKKKWQDITHPEDIEYTKQQMNALISGKVESVHYEKRYIKKDGSILWVELFSTYIKNREINHSYFLSSLVNITDRKIAEATIEENEIKYQVFIENSNEIILSVNDKGEFIFVNQVFASTLGNTKEYFIGKNLWDVYPKQHADYRFEAIKRVFQTGKRETLEVDVPLPDKNMYFLATICPIKDKSGKVIMVMTNGTDITDRKKSEDSLRESEELFRTSFESSIVGICMVGVDGSFLRVNDNICTILGYSRAELLAKSFIDVTFIEDKDISTTFLNELLAGKIKSSNFEKRYVKKDGNIIWANVSISAIHNKQNKFQYFITYIQDINERKIAETKLRESEEKFGRVFHEAPVWISITDLETAIYLEVNDEALRATGFSRDEVIGHTAAEIGWITIEQRQRLVQEIQTHGRITDLEMDFHAKNRNILYGLVNGEQIEVNGKPCLLTVTIDITGRKLAEEIKQNSELKFGQMFEVSPVGIVMVGFNSRFIECNPEFLQFLGYKKEELVGKLIEDVTLPEDSQIGKAAMMAISKGEINKSQVHKRYIRKDGQVVWGETTISLVKDAKNIPQYFLAIIQNVTEQKMAEELTKNIIEMNPVSMQILDNAGFTLNVNPAFKNLFGSIPPADYSIFNDQQLAQKGLGKIFDKLRNGEVVHFPDVSFNPHDSIPALSDVPNWIRTIGFPLTSTYKKAQKFVLMQENITERKQIEEKLLNEATRRRILMEQSKDGIVIINQEGNVIESNREFADMLGYPLESMCQLSVYDWEFLAPRERLGEMIKNIDERGDHFETIHRRKDGSIYDVEISTNAAWFDGQKLIFCVCRDITERKQAETALFESEKKFARVFNDAPVWIAISDMSTGTYLEINEEALHVSGFSREEVIGHKSVEIGWISADDRKRLVEEIQDHGRITDMEMSFHTKSGEVLYGLVNGEQMEVKGLSCLLTITVDITDRKQEQEKVRDSEKKLKKAQHYAHIGSWSWNIMTNHLEWSDEMFRIFGLERESFTGVLEEVVSKAIHPDDRAKVDKSNLSVIKYGKPIPLEYRIIYPDKSIHTVWAEAGEMIKDESGSVIQLNGTVQDITERKETEAQMVENMDELKRWYEATLDREDRVLELKHEVNELLSESGKPIRYISAEE